MPPIFTIAVHLNFIPFRETFTYNTFIFLCDTQLFERSKKMTPQAEDAPIKVNDFFFCTLKDL